MDRLVGYKELAELFSVSDSTPRVWRHRGLLPEPVQVVSGTPVWWLSQIQAWGGPNRDK